jgi:hypothetical protein
VSDNNERSSSPSSSPSLLPDQLLERLLTGIAKGLDGLVEGNTKIVENLDSLVKGNTEIAKVQSALLRDNQELRQAFGDLRKAVFQHHSRTESRITDQQIALDQFILRVEAVIDHQKIAAGVAYSQRQVLDRSKASLDTAVAVVKEATDRIQTLRGEHPEDSDGEAPLFVRRFAVRVTNFVWPVAVRRGPEAVKWGFKLITGSVTIGALAKIIHILVTHL